MHLNTVGLADIRIGVHIEHVNFISFTYFFLLLGIQRATVYGKIWALEYSPHITYVDQFRP